MTLMSECLLFIVSKVINISTNTIYL